MNTTIKTVPEHLIQSLHFFHRKYMLFFGKRMYMSAHAQLGFTKEKVKDINCELDFIYLFIDLLSN